MTARTVTNDEAPGKSGLHRLRRPSYALWFPLAVYAATRLIDALFIVLAARHQIALPTGATGLAGYKIWEPSPASPGYGSVASNWDGQWYFSIGWLIPVLSSWHSR